MSRRVLVANRGEIAVRVIRACHDLGWVAIAVYSDVDAGSLHVRLADEAVQIGPASATESYLNQDALLAAAKKTGAEAIHPGYGFLAENASFADAVITAGLRWVGPSPDVIRMMGDKAEARQAAVSAGVPVVPGSEVLRDSEHAKAEAERIGYPVLIKASAGGGGKGIRPATDADQLTTQVDEARQEVLQAFGDDALYIEKALNPVRHVEVQVLGDNHGQVIHLFERECSLQRRRQKVVEEAPAPTLPAEVASAMHAAALTLAQAVSYTSAGTIEFLVDTDNRFYFIEMNTRIQVEHGVTEMLTGIDLVTTQLRIAFNEPLGLSQTDVVARGAVIELRVNAENPNLHFLGSPGTVDMCELPTGPGVRVDTGVTTGSTIQPYYDSMIAKILVSGLTRDEALARARRALRETTWNGPVTTLRFVAALIDAPWFAAANFHTRTVENELPRILASL